MTEEKISETIAKLQSIKNAPAKYGEFKALVGELTMHFNMNELEKLVSVHSLNLIMSQTGCIQCS